MKIDWK